MTKSRTWLWRALVAGVLLVPAYFLIGGVATHQIDDDLATVIPAETGKPAQIASTLENILAREIEGASWRPNNPWFYPTALADNKTNFQLGVLQGLRRSLLEYASRTVRARGDGSLDPDLQAALNQLQYPPDIWMFDVSQGFGASTESQYRAALASLRAFGKKAADGAQFVELRADQLHRFVDAINVDLTAHVLSSQDYATHKAWVIDTRADDIFYQTKGAAFVYAALASAIRQDFAAVFAQKNLGDLWAQFETNLDSLIALRPITVLAGKSDGLLFPNHLLTQAFYAARCADILTHIEEILRT
jgi:hypothetical protein